jgi:hypothetical protein
MVTRGTPLSSLFAKERDLSPLLESTLYSIIFRGGENHSFRAIERIKVKPDKEYVRLPGNSISGCTSNTDNTTAPMGYT